MPAFRTRDVVAAVLALLFSQLLHTYDHGSESLSAEINLAFYTEYISSVSYSVDIGPTSHEGNDSFHQFDIDVARPVPLDLDGDGLPEALVVPSLVSSKRNKVDNGWILKVHDLMNLFQVPSQQSGHPIYPNTIFETKHAINDEPEQIIPIKIVAGQIIPNLNESATRAFVTTSKGTLPSMVSVWNNGDIVLHSITSESGLDDTYLAKKSNTKNNDLRMIEMWKINPFKAFGHVVQFEEIDLVLDTNITIGKHSHGVVVLGTNYYLIQEESMPLHSAYFAIDSFSGDIIWSQSTQSQTIEDKYALVLEANNHTIHNKEVDQTPVDIFQMSKDCLDNYYEAFVNPYTNILPHSFNNPKDARIHLTNFDVKSNKAGSEEEDKKEEESQPSSSSSSSNYDKVRHGIPNVILFHNRKGINVMSLTHGEPICFTPLPPGRLYADLNKDGIIDHLQVKTNGSNEWFKQQKDTTRSSQKHEMSEYFCDATISSFDYNKVVESDVNFTMHLCTGNIERSLQTNTQMGLSIGNPLLVESFNGIYDKSTHDIIFAVNHGSLQRYGANGDIQWRKSSHDSIPKWHEEADGKNGFLDRIGYKLAYDEVAADRPIIAFGDDKMTLITAGKGSLLCSQSIPQLMVGKPILLDFNRDGTTDVVVISKDAIWGYYVKISGRRVVSALAIFTLFVALIIALINRRERRWQRATDLY